MTQTLADYETPRLVVDRTKLMRNLTRMQQRAKDLGVVLRPHLKTTKSVEVARLATGEGEPRITVSTLKEADYFAAAGYRDILYAVGVAPNKLAHAARLRREGVDLTLLLDSVEAVAACSAAAAEHGVVYPLMIEIDTDGHRGGVAPSDSGRLIEIASRIAADPGLTLRGIMTHAGESYECRTVEGIVAMAEQERAGAVEAAGHIRAAGIDCPDVSVGSTPTACVAKSEQGTTELRAGVYMFFDLVMAGLGVCAVDDIAVSVLATVIGHQPDKGWVMVDAGWMAMSRDRGTEKQAIDQGYGLVCDASGKLLDDVIMNGANQEHGLLTRRSGAPLTPADLPLGTQVRILPNHACATGAQHGSYLVTEGNSPVVTAKWDRMGGW
jgi:D-serine deaminase-like pyridoxal phosphate-dependent protein